MINSIHTKALIAGAAALLVAQSGWALSAYSQNFEALGAGDPGALSGNGYQIAGIVYDGDVGAAPPYGNFKFFYGNFPAPNGGPGFSAIASGEAGAAQGTQYLNAYSDYNCCGAGTTNEGHFDTTGTIDRVQSSVFQEQTIAAGDVGTTWTLSFDGKLPSANGCGTTATSECIAFIRTLDPNNGYATTYRAIFDSKTLGTADWTTHVLSLGIDPSLSGQLVQFGFQSVSQQFGNTGVFYDNINFAAVPVPGAAWLFGSALAVLGGVRRRRLGA